MAPAPRAFLTRITRLWRSDQRWGLVLCLFSLLALSIVFVSNRRAIRPETDGIHNWAFARSLVFDRDLNFTNDYRLCGDPGGFSARQHVPGRPDNSFYIGPTVIWAPLLAVARLVVTVKPNAPPAQKAGCGPPHTSFVFYVAGPMLATLILFLCYRCARRIASDGAAAAAAALVGLGGSLSAYAAQLTWIGHVHSAFAASLFLLATLRAWERPERLRRWIVVAAAFLFVVFERPTDAVLGLAAAVAALIKLRGQPEPVAPDALAPSSKLAWLRRWTGWLTPRLALVGALLVVAFVLGNLPQMFVSRYLNGTWAPSATSQNYVYLDHAHPFLLLFATHGGLFYYTPTAWTAVFGAVVGVRQRDWRPLVIALLASCALAVYVNSAPLDWHGSGTFGARRLVFLAPVFILFAAFFTEWVRRLFVERPRLTTAVAALALVVPLAAINLIAVIAQGNVVVRIDSASLQADLYGSSRRLVWSYIDEHFGPLAVWPAVLVFKLRYGLPASAYYSATDTFWYKRAWLTLAWFAKDIPRFDPKLATGAQVDPGKLLFTEPRGTYVFATQWPFATHVWVKTWAPKPANLRIGRGRLFGTTWYGSLKVGPTEQRQELAIPEGGFDSGILEVVFEPDQPGVEVRGLGFDDRAPRPKPWARAAAPSHPLAGLTRPAPGPAAVPTPR
jgi:hypothetical protein